VDLSLLENKYLIAFASSIGGVILTLITQQIANKIGLFTYFVRHSRVDVSVHDAAFGSVHVTWNGKHVENLHSSTVELINQSLRDYENVVVSACTSDTMLLTERTEIVGTSHVAKWTDEFLKQLQVKPGEQPTEAQIALHSSRRDYLLPVMNRGQIIRWHFLNAAKIRSQPSIWLDVVHKGVRLRFSPPQNEIFGVPQPRAALIGVVIGFVLLGVIIAMVQTVWIAALCSFAYGLVAQLPGAWTVKLWRYLRDWFGG